MMKRLRYDIPQPEQLEISLESADLGHRHFCGHAAHLQKDPKANGCRYRSKRTRHQKQSLAMASSPFRLSPLNIFLSIALVVTLFVLMVDAQRPRDEQAASDRHYEGCTGEVRQDVQLSQEQLAQVLTVPERDAKANIRAILAEPYCSLPPIEIRSGVQAEREAYPLAFNPEAWLVILYEGDEYAGHRISIKS